MMGPEQERLEQRLFGDPKRKTKNFSITPGDKPATAEQICGEINKAMDEIERRRSNGDLGDNPPMSGKPSISLRDALNVSLKSLR